VLDATWLIFDGTMRVDGGTSRIDEVVGGLGRADAVAAQSRALARLSEEIAAAVRRAGRRP
jgi:hypothetical protein